MAAAACMFMLVITYESAASLGSRRRYTSIPRPLPPSSNMVTSFYLCKTLKCLIIFSSEKSSTIKSTLYSTYWPSYLLSIKFLYMSPCMVSPFMISLIQSDFSVDQKLNRNGQIKAIWLLLFLKILMLYWDRIHTQYNLTI